MDTSDKYIYMCLKSVEVQEYKGLSWDAGDFVYFANTTNSCEIVTHARVRREGEIWIPRMDQLLQIIHDKHVGIIPVLLMWNLLSKFHREPSRDRYEFDDSIMSLSMEQFLLVSIMRFEYNKRLKDGEWVDSEMNKIHISAEFGGLLEVKGAK